MINPFFYQPSYKPPPRPPVSQIQNECGVPIHLQFQPNSNQSSQAKTQGRSTSTASAPKFKKSVLENQRRKDSQDNSRLSKLVVQAEQRKSVTRRPKSSCSASIYGHGISLNNDFKHFVPQTDAKKGPYHDHSSSSVSILSLKDQVGKKVITNQARHEIRVSCVFPPTPTNERKQPSSTDLFSEISCVKPQKPKRVPFQSVQLNHKAKKPLLPTEKTQFLKSDELFKQYPMKLKAQAKENLKPVKLQSKKNMVPEEVPEPQRLEVKPVEPNDEFKQVAEQRSGVAMLESYFQKKALKQQTSILKLSDSASSMSLLSLKDAGIVSPTNYQNVSFLHDIKQQILPNKQQMFVAFQQPISVRGNPQAMFCNQLLSQQTAGVGASPNDMPPSDQAPQKGLTKFESIMKSVESAKSSRSLKDVTEDELEEHQMSTLKLENCIQNASVVSLSIQHSENSTVRKYKPSEETTVYKDQFQRHSDTFSIEKVWQEMQELRLKHKKIDDCFNKVNEVLRSPELGEMPERFSTPAESPKKQDPSENQILVQNRSVSSNSIGREKSSVEKTFLKHFLSSDYFSPVIINHQAILDNRKRLLEDTPEIRAAGNVQQESFEEDSSLKFDRSELIKRMLEL